MPKGGIPIGKAFGIALRLHYSWFFIFALVTYTLVVNYFPSSQPTWSMALKIAAGLLTSVLLFASLLAHELSHSLVAQRQGIKVESITLFLLGGVAQLTRDPEKPGDEFRMAFAGPLCSLVLGGIFYGIHLVLIPFTGTALEFTGAIAYWLGYINLSLGVFNLIPGFPLDGGRVLRSLIWGARQNLSQATKIASNIGRVVGFIFIFGGIFLVFTPYWFTGIWSVLIGWFLESSATGSYRQMLMEEMLKGHIASEVMTRDCALVSPDITIDQLINDNILTTGKRCFPVASGDRMEGMITMHNIKNVPRDQRGIIRVREAMTPLGELKSVRPDEDLSTVLRILVENDINQIPVVQDNKIIGLIGRDSILAYIGARNELGK
jgi:Zn-dependent protease/predicted transcriptional regulator